MKLVFSVFFLTIALIGTLPAFAENYEVRILEGSSTQGCEITDSCLSPSKITIHQGDTINWIREENISHAIKAETPNDQMIFFTMDYSHTFHDVGTFDYFVTEMPWIQGTIIVKTAPTSKQYSIMYDENGGDCNKIGNWDKNSKTCTLEKDLHNVLVINSNNIILDGNNHKIMGNYMQSQTDYSACVYADAKIGITIQNFELINCGYGVSFQDVLDSKITNNLIHDNLVSGIVMIQSSNNLIENNEIFNQTGIGLNGDGNIIKSNLIYVDNKKDKSGYGISINIQDSSDNVIIDNTISGYKSGLTFDGVFENNEINNNEISDNQIGINLNTSEQFFVVNNTINANEIGIRSDTYENGGKHVIEKNFIINNEEGIHLESGFNTLRENTISDNEIALWFEPRDQHTFDYNNKIYANNFINNSRQVFHGETNFFTVNNSGNYWSDFSPNCMDANSDKICDKPYPFSSGSVSVTDNAVWIEKDGWLTTELLESTPSEEYKKIPQPENLDSNEMTKLSIAPFVDPNKDPQYYIDRYNNEAEYREWFDENYPEYDSIEHAVGLELTRNVPDWVQNTALWYGQGKISEDEFLNAIQYLVNQGIIKIIEN